MIFVKTLKKNLVHSKFSVFISFFVLSALSGGKWPLSQFTYGRLLTSLFGNESLWYHDFYEEKPSEG